MGCGPAGLAAARALQNEATRALEYGHEPIVFVVFERRATAGGLWN